MSTLENPFHPHLKGPGETNPAKDVELAKQLLGDADAALLESVCAGTRGQGAQGTTRGDIMTDEERAMLAQVEAKEHENIWGRGRYVAWSQSIGKDEQWVDDTFVFNNDGTVETKEGLDLSKVKSLSSFPPNLTTVNGTLDLYNLPNADRLILPQTVNGNLYLARLTSAESLTFPKMVNGSIYLDRLTSANNTIWPTHIGRDLYAPRVFVPRGKQLITSGVLKGNTVCTD